MSCFCSSTESIVDREILVVGNFRAEKFRVNFFRCQGATSKI